MNKRMLVVEKSAGDFTTINDAIDFAKSYATKTNRVIIVIGPGIYNETINLLDNPGIDLIGMGAGITTIKAVTTYPYSTIYVTGDFTCIGITFIADSGSNSYALHYEILDTSVTGHTRFVDCEFIGRGVNGVGAGLGANCTLEFQECRMISDSRYPLYFHNNAFSNKQNQMIIVRNCFLNGAADGVSILADDAANMYGNANSKITVLFSGNSSLCGGFWFRKTESETYTYIPKDDSNYTLSSGSAGNGILGLEYGKEHILISSYIFKASNPANGTSLYNYSIPVDNANSYNWSINDITVPGVGSITSHCSISGVGSTSVNIQDDTSDGAGNYVAVSVFGTPK